MKQQRNAQAIESPIDRFVSRLRAISEAILAIFIALAPWGYGASLAIFELAIACGIAMLVVIWSLETLLKWRVPWVACPFGAGLSLIFLLGIVSLIPMPESALNILSPGTANLYRELLPEVREVLSGETLQAPLMSSPGSTLSLAPGNTKRELVHWLTAILLYSVVRSQIASASMLNRLAILITINGAFLSAFALVQFFTSPPGTMFWIDRPVGSPFGTFVNRNHFSFYVNIAIGAAIGLSLRYSTREDVRHLGEMKQDMLAGIRRALNSPAALWIGLALLLMCTAVAMSLSRGGLISLVLSITIAFAIFGSNGTISVRRLGFLAAIGTAIPLLIWLGIDRLTTRWSRFIPDAAGDDRFDLWASSLRIASQMPVFGTGPGTFSIVEPMRRFTSAHVDFTALHAENELFEAIVEGGILRLAITIALAAFALRFAYRAVQDAENRETAATAVGGFIGLCTITLHSLVDFGLHLPAIALLGVVLAACMNHLGTKNSRDSRASDETLGFSLHPVAAIAAALLSAYVVLRAESVRARAVELRVRALATNVAADERIALLEQAAELQPDDSSLQLAIALAQSEIYESETAKLELEAIPLETKLRALADQSSEEAESLKTRIALFEKRREGLRADYAVSAAQRLVYARDHAPTSAYPQLLLGMSYDDFDESDFSEEYLTRAKSLAPSNAHIWHSCGEAEIVGEESIEEGCRSWRRSLELSAEHLHEILDASSEYLTLQDLETKLLPDNAAILFRAANYQYPDRDDPGLRKNLPPEMRQRLMTRALTVLSERVGAAATGDLHLEARILSELGRNTEAIERLRTALLKMPEQYDWRLFLAERLAAEGRAEEAQRELDLVLARVPKSAQALALRQKLLRGEGRKKETTPELNATEEKETPQ